MAARRPRSTREDWLELGFDILAGEGERSLTIDTLCRRMGRTKGSFYHHFADRHAYVVALMTHWESRYTLRVIDEMEPYEQAREKLVKLGEMTARDVDLRLERRIRVWADREPAVRDAVERVDRARERYLHEQFTAAFGDAHKARLAARCHMALLVGTQMLYQDLSREQLRELNDFAERLGFDDDRP